METSSHVSTDPTPLPPEIEAFTRRLCRSTQLKVARSFSSDTTSGSDSFENRLTGIRNRLRQSRPDHALLVSRRSNRLLDSYRNLPDFAPFHSINARAIGAVDQIALRPEDAVIPPARMGEIVAALDLAIPAGLHAGGVTPQATTSRLKFHHTKLHCKSETNWSDEPSASDEIVLGVHWITPAGKTGYRWWRRENFDEGETKSVEWTFAWDLIPKGKQQFLVLYTLIEEDWDNAASWIEETFHEIVEELKKKSEDFAAWLAGEIGWSDLGPILASILKSAISFLFGWLIGLFGSNVMGTYKWTLTVSNKWAPKWSQTGTNTLPLPMTFKWSGGHYKLPAEAILV